jgi:N-dimethylarginine dimethylaminohydrolase
MVGALQRVLVCSPRIAGWNQPERAARWRDLGFHHAPNFAEAQAQHDALCRELEAAGAEVLEAPPAPDLSLDAVYAHDASLATDFGLIVLRPGKANRLPEGRNHGSFCTRLGIPTLAKIVAPGTTEAGDILWLEGKTPEGKAPDGKMPDRKTLDAKTPDAKSLLVGHGYRTNAAGIAQLRHLLASKGVDVLSAPLPHGPGPSACLHLMSLISLLDEHTALVDLPWLAVETVELLQSRGYKFIPIDDSERDTLACNVLALGGNRLLAIAENRNTNDRLRQAGFDVRTFPGSELCINGSGGPTCLTRPLLRG